MVLHRNFLTLSICIFILYFLYFSYIFYTFNLYIFIGNLSRFSPKCTWLKYGYNGNSFLKTAEKP